MESDFVEPQQYARQAAEMSGAMPSAGGAPYPLYGLPPGMGQTEEVPFYRQPLVCFSAGAAVVGAAWLYFAWWRPKQKKVARNKRPPATDDDDE